MAAIDKTIPELNPLPGAIQLADLGIISRGNADFKFTIQQLTDFLQDTLTLGSNITFAAGAPADNFGSDKDVSIDAAAQKFYQRVNGSWVLQYAVDVTGIGNKVIFAPGAPNAATGIYNDTYVDTTTGKFYNKTDADTWVQVFSMATGPAGAPGADGLPGTPGTNGNTVRNGTTPPSNDLGNNGDFYINTNTLMFYGPKTAGVWGAGQSLLDISASPIEVVLPAGTTANPYTYNYDGSIGDKVKAELAIINDDTTETIIGGGITRNSDGTAFIINVQPDGSGNFLNSYKLTLYPSGEIDNQPASGGTGRALVYITSTQAQALSTNYLNATYPGALHGDITFVPIANLKYLKIDDSPTGMWEEMPFNKAQ